MKFIALMFLSLAAFAADSKPADADKLKVREAQLQTMAAYADMMAAQVKYQQAAAAQNAAIADLSKKLGCEIDPQTVECKAKPESKDQGTH